MREVAVEVEAPPVPLADSRKPDFKIDQRIAAGLNNRFHAAEGRQASQHWRARQCKVARRPLCNGLDSHAIQLQSCVTRDAADFGRQGICSESSIRVVASNRKDYSEYKRQRADAKM